jgi:hypothetical protein
VHREPARVAASRRGKSAGDSVANPAGSPQQRERVDHIRAEGAVLLCFLANSGKVRFQEAQAGIASGAGALAFRQRGPVSSLQS